MVDALLVVANSRYYVILYSVVNMKFITLFQTTEINVMLLIGI